MIAPPHSVVRLKVEQFSTDDYDHVTIGRGLHAADVSSQLYTLYGHRQEQEVLVVPVNTLWIHFEADDSDTDTGFLISFETVPRGMAFILKVYKLSSSHSFSACYAIYSTF